MRHGRALALRGLTVLLLAALSESATDDKHASESSPDRIVGSSASAESTFDTPLATLHTQSGQADSLLDTHLTPLHTARPGQADANRGNATQGVHGEPNVTAGGHEHANEHGAGHAGHGHPHTAMLFLVAVDVDERMSMIAYNAVRLLAHSACS